MDGAKKNNLLAQMACNPHRPFTFAVYTNYCYIYNRNACIFINYGFWHSHVYFRFS